MALAERVTKKKGGLDPRLKLLLFGMTGAGKTTASVWPDAYIIDTEHGTDHYGQMLAGRNCAVLHTTDIEEASRHIRELMSTEHDFKTLVIDPITTLYEDSQNRWTDRYTTFHQDKGETGKAEMQDFGPAYWGKVKREQKQFISLLKRIDMNVIVTAHEKDKYAPGAGLTIIGQTFDGLKGLDYLFDTVLRLTLEGDKRMARPIKDRTGKFPEPFEYEYDTILSAWGEALARKAEAVKFATGEQVEQIRKLLEVVKVRDDWETDVLRKAEVDSWSEMDSDTIGKCIDTLTKKLPAGAAA
jgi:hypothetical protein